MTDTPQTDEEQIHHRLGWPKFARKLESELAVAKKALARARFEANERLHRLNSAHSERRTMLEAHEQTKRERDTAQKAEREALAKMCQAFGYLSTIAEDCDAWLNNQTDETACDFIKLVKKYAKDATYGNT